MAFSMEAARMAATRTVCDVCDAMSSAPRGAVCRTCTVGTMRFHSELQVLRDQRKAARAAARDQQLLR